MNAPLGRLSATILLALLAISQADQAGTPKDKTKLVTRIYKAPASLFLVSSPEEEKNADPSTAAKALPPTSDGELRYDVWARIESWGVRKIPGVEAIYLKDSADVVVTARLEEFSFHIDPMIGDQRPYGPPRFVEITASLWEYEDDQFTDTAFGVRRFAELRQRAGNSLKLLDSQVVATKSGQRGAVLSKQSETSARPLTIPAAKPLGDAAIQNTPRIALDGARGSFLEVEPAINPDGETVDLSAITYEARLKLAGAESDVKIEVKTDLVLKSDHDMIPFCALAHEDAAAAQQGKVKRHALVIGARIIDTDGRTISEAAEQEARRAEQVIRRARAGINASKK